MASLAGALYSLVPLSALRYDLTGEIGSVVEMKHFHVSPIGVYENLGRKSRCKHLLVPFPAFHSFAQLFPT